MSIQKKKIITCAPLPPPYGGIANWYNILLSEGAANGYTFLNINTSPRKSIDGRSLFYRIFVQGFRMLKQSQELRKLIKNNDDVHVAHITTSGHLALFRDILFLRLCKKKGIRTVYHLHFGRLPRIFKNKNWECRLSHKAFSLASEIIAIDPKTYEVLCENFGREHVHYIFNPVKRISVDVKENSKNIIFLGNVLPAKGIEELLQAWEKLSPIYKDWKLTIAGFCEDSYKVHLESQYSMKNVEMLGYVSHDDAMKKLAESAFLVLPSYSEGFPNVVIEAMMCGKAVIGTDVGAIADILSGGCGIVIPSKSVGSLIEGIRQLIVDESSRTSMGNSGRAKALSNYISETVFNEYAKLWCISEGAK